MCEETPSSRSSAATSAISCARRAAWRRLPCSMRSSVSSSAEARRSRSSPRTKSSSPAARAAASASQTTAATPFQPTERRSLRVAASPAGASRTVTGMPSGPSTDPNTPAPPPDTSAGVRSPRPGTGAMSATSANPAPVGATIRASSALSSGEPVLRSAKT